MTTCRRSRTAPCSRGWTLVGHNGVHHHGDRPVFAGMDPSLARCWPCATRPPRVRGDGPSLRVLRGPRSATAPCSRGWTLIEQMQLIAVGDRPVFAGMDPPSLARRTSWCRPPRVRGDGPYSSGSRSRTRPTAPCSRGWTPTDPAPSGPATDRPVFAGMDPLPGSPLARPSRPPRVRGDGPIRGVVDPRN